MITASQFAALPKAATRIRPGDTLRIVRDTHDAATLDLRNLVDDAQAQNYLVRPDGTISFRHAGRVEAAGKTPDELALFLRARLEGIYREPGVTVNIQISPSSKIVIGGAVRNPTTIDLNAVANLEQALFATGGLLTSADPRRVALLRLDEQDRYQVYFIDLSQVLIPGEGRASIELMRGDIVFVPKSSAGESAEGVDLYFNQLLPFSRSLGVGLNKNID
jgi:protein involved in polysaccharide export with SLBB domain